MLTIYSKSESLLGKEVQVHPYFAHGLAVFVTLLVSTQAWALKYPDPKIGLKPETFGDMNKVADKKQYLFAWGNVYIDQYIEDFIVMNKIKDNRFPKSLKASWRAKTDALSDDFLKNVKIPGDTNYLKMFLDATAKSIYGPKPKGKSALAQMRAEMTDLIVDNEVKTIAAVNRLKAQVQADTAQFDKRLRALEASAGIITGSTETASPVSDTIPSRYKWAIALSILLSLGSVVLATGKK